MNMQKNRSPRRLQFITRSSGPSLLLCRVSSAMLPGGNRPPSGREGTVAKRYRVTLTAEERAGLEALISRGKADARKLAHARILLQADEADGAPARADEE